MEDQIITKFRLKRRASEGYSINYEGGEVDKLTVDTNNKGRNTKLSPINTRGLDLNNNVGGSLSQSRSKKFAQSRTSLSQMPKNEYINLNYN